jgi:ligand of Numb protein X 3/4
VFQIDPKSVAGKDGRVKEGDQILQINGVDVRSRDEAISLFSSSQPDITLLVARPQLQVRGRFDWLKM